MSEIGIWWSWPDRGIRDTDGIRTHHKSAVRHFGSSSVRKFHVGDPVVVLSSDGKPWFAQLIGLFDENVNNIPGAEDSPTRMRCSLRWFYRYSDVNEETNGFISLNQHIMSHNRLFFSDHIDIGTNPVYVIQALLWLFPTVSQAKEFKNHPNPTALKDRYESNDKIRVLDRYFDVLQSAVPPIRKLKPGELNLLISNPDTDHHFKRHPRSTGHAVTKSARLSYQSNQQGNDSDDHDDNGYNSCNDNNNHNESMTDNERDNSANDADSPPKDVLKQSLSSFIQRPKRPRVASIQSGYSQYSDDALNEHSDNDGNSVGNDSELADQLLEAAEERLELKKLDERFAKKTNFYHDESQEEEDLLTTLKNPSERTMSHRRKAKPRRRISSDSTSNERNQTPVKSNNTNNVDYSTSSPSDETKRHEDSIDTNQPETIEQSNGKLEEHQVEKRRVARRVIDDDESESDSEMPSTKSNVEPESNHLQQISSKFKANIKNSENVLNDPTSDNDSVRATDPSNSSPSSPDNRLADNRLKCDSPLSYIPTYPTSLPSAFPEHSTPVLPPTLDPIQNVATLTPDNRSNIQCMNSSSTIAKTEDAVLQPQAVHDEKNQPESSNVKKKKREILRLHSEREQGDNGDDVTMNDFQNNQEEAAAKIHTNGRNEIKNQERMDRLEKRLSQSMTSRKPVQVQRKINNVREISILNRMKPSIPAAKSDGQPPNHCINHEAADKNMSVTRLKEESTIVPPPLSQSDTRGVQVEKKSTVPKSTNNENISDISNIEEAVASSDEDRGVQYGLTNTVESRTPGRDDRAIGRIEEVIGQSFEGIRIKSEDEQQQQQHQQAQSPQVDAADEMMDTLSSHLKSLTGDQRNMFYENVEKFMDIAYPYITKWLDDTGGQTDAMDDVEADRITKMALNELMLTPGKN